METSESILEVISGVTEFNDLHDELKDPELDLALAAVVSLVMSPSMSSAKAAESVVKLQALSARFKMQATTYKVLNPGRSGTDQYKRKNVYFAISDSLDKLVDALKYMARYGMN